MSEICKGNSIRSYGNGNYYLEVHDGDIRETYYEVDSQVFLEVARKYDLNFDRLTKTIRDAVTPETCMILIIPDEIREAWDEEDKKLLPPLPPVGDFVQLKDGGIFRHVTQDIFINTRGATFHWNEIASRVIFHGSIHWRNTKGDVK